MKPSTIRKASIFLVLVPLVLASCSGQTIPGQTEQSTAISTSSPVFNFSETPSFTRSPTLTATIKPSSTFTLTAPATLMPSATITPTDLPTLNPTQAIDEFQKYLNQGENCKSLCLWGITLGQTTLDQARRVFNYWGSPLIEGNSSNEFSTGLKNYQEGISIKDSTSADIDLTIEKGTVKNIVTSITLPVYKKVPLPRAWLAFSPETILNKYGAPSEVDFGIAFPAEPGFPPDIAWYSMIFKYDSLNLTIFYYHGTVAKGNILKACPLSDQFSAIKIWMGKDSKNVWTLSYPLEKATNLTIDQFSSLLTQKSNSACFDISVEGFFK